MADEEALFHNLSVVVRSLKCLHSPWLEVKETLEKLKIWAKVRNNRYHKIHLYKYSNTNVSDFY